MKSLMLGTAFAIVGLVPAIGSACEYTDASMASATPPAKLGLATPPAASQAPAPTVAKAPAVKQAKEVDAKAATPTPQGNLVAVSAPR